MNPGCGEFQAPRGQVARKFNPAKLRPSIQEERGMHKRIAVVGAGAVGGYIGSSLFHAGHDVMLIDPWPVHVEAIRAQGMQLYGMTEAERKTVKVPALHLTEAQQIAKQRPIDIALISVKSYDTIWACRMIKQYLAPDGIVVSIQNCMNEERVAAAAGWGRTLGIIVGGGVGVDLYEPGHIRRGYTKRPEVTSFYVGEPSGLITKRSRELAAIMNDVDNASAPRRPTALRFMIRSGSCCPRDYPWRLRPGWGEQLPRPAVGPRVVRR
jgi:2-dehydropantoate 2-reductase